MRKREPVNRQQLQLLAARRNVRKAANTLAHAVRLGKVAGITEAEYGECETPKCPISGRLFHAGGKQRCVLCVSRALGVIK